MSVLPPHCVVLSSQLELLLKKSDREEQIVRLAMVKDLLSVFDTHKTACPVAHRSLRYFNIAHEIPTDPPNLNDHFGLWSCNFVVT